MAAVRVKPTTASDGSGQQNRKPARSGHERVDAAVTTVLPGCRHGPNSLERELIIPFGRVAPVTLFEIVSEGEVVVLARRDQREDDYH